MHIAIACDHGGFEQKKALVIWLKTKGYTVSDFGCESSESVDYPDYALPAAKMVASGKADYGVLICGTGIGMCIAANKVHGIRAAGVMSQQFAQLAREHNDANILTLSGRFNDLETNKRIIETFLNTKFSGGRHARRVEKMMAIEGSLK